jgi:hypothetical protein
MMGSEYLVKGIACLLILVGAAGFIAGLLGFFGPLVISVSPWLLTSAGLVMLLSGYGLMTRDLDEIT